MRIVAAAGAGFLLAVLWMDLMFDVQARGHRDRPVPPSPRASIAAYYARVTTAARPMNRLIALVMLVTVGSLAFEVVDGTVPAWRSVPALVLAIGAVALAGARTVPNAVRLGTGADDDATQSRLAVAILRDHVSCVVAIVAVLVLLLIPVPSG